MPTIKAASYNAALAATAPLFEKSLSDREQDVCFKNQFKQEQERYTAGNQHAAFK